jgi:hypothetical protein
VSSIVITTTTTIITVIRESGGGVLSSTGLMQELRLAVFGGADANGFPPDALPKSLDQKMSSCGLAVIPFLRASAF